MPDDWEEQKRRAQSPFRTIWEKPYKPIEVEKNPIAAYERYCQRENVIPNDEEREKWITGWTKLAERVEEARKEPVEAQYREIVSPKIMYYENPSDRLNPPAPKEHLKGEAYPMSTTLRSAIAALDEWGDIPFDDETRLFENESLLKYGNAENLKDELVKMSQNGAAGQYQALNLAITAFEEMPNYGLACYWMINKYSCGDAVKAVLADTRDAINSMDVPVEYAEHMLQQRISYISEEHSERRDKDLRLEIATDYARMDIKRLVMEAGWEAEREIKAIGERLHKDINNLHLETIQKIEDIEPEP